MIVAFFIIIAGVGGLWYLNKSSTLPTPDGTARTGTISVASKNDRTVTFNTSVDCSDVPAGLADENINFIDFGDGSSTQNVNCETSSFSHTFSSAGSYTVNLYTAAYGTTDIVNSTKRELAQVNVMISGGTTSSGSYTLSDVASVTKRNVDPIPSAIDDEYTEYTITLKNGTKYGVKVYGNATLSMNEQGFRNTGYTGDVQALMKIAG